MNRKVLSLAQSFNGIKEANLLLPNSTSKELVEDPLKSMESSQRWKVKTAYGDIGLRYQDDQTVAYVAARMPAVYSALHRVLSEVYKSCSSVCSCVCVRERDWVSYGMAIMLVYLIFCFTYLCASIIHFN